MFLFKKIRRRDVVEDEALVRERAAFTALHPTLLTQYPGEYVAIHNGALVDHDKDGLTLSLRVHQRFPHEFRARHRAGRLRHVDRRRRAALRHADL